MLNLEKEAVERITLPAHDEAEVTSLFTPMEVAGIKIADLGFHFEESFIFKKEKAQPERVIVRAPLTSSETLTWIYDHINRRHSTIGDVLALAGSRLGQSGEIALAMPTKNQAHMAGDPKNIFFIDNGSDIFAVSVYLLNHELRFEQIAAMSKVPPQGGPLVLSGAYVYFNE